MTEERVSITTEYIKLDQLLKFANVAMSGADAKDMILSEMVEVNGELCTMRGKKMRSGDTCTVYFEDETVRVVVE
ncbi:MAG: RNA-binding S4 domain-containing protein [Clostridia bacterium]|nr:RNA-binding S4 domain-containing protein [Clostridia bacterium]